MATDMLLSIGLFVCLVCGQMAGRWLGRRIYRGTEPPPGNGAADGVVFAVLGLLIAFTFTTSAGKFDERRKLIAEQANALGTAWQRLDVLPQEDQGAIRQRMAKWAELAGDSSHFSGPMEMQKAVAEGARLRGEVWSLAVASIERAQKPQLNAFVLGAMNEWMDDSSKRQSMDDLMLPPMVLPTLIVFSVIASVLAGFNMSRLPQRIPLHMLTFAAAVSFAIYVIVDLNSPRAGLIRLTDMDAEIRQLGRSFRQQMGSTTQP